MLRGGKGYLSLSRRGDESGDRSSPRRFGSIRMGARSIDRMGKRMGHQSPDNLCLLGNIDNDKGARYEAQAARYLFPSFRSPSLSLSTPSASRLISHRHRFLSARPSLQRARLINHVSSDARISLFPFSTDSNRNAREKGAASSRVWTLLNRGRCMNMHKSRQ